MRNKNKTFLYILFLKVLNMWRKNSVGIRDLPKRRPIAHSSSLTDSNINIPPVSGKKLRKQTVRLPENVQLPAVHTHYRQVNSLKLKYKNSNCYSDAFPLSKFAAETDSLLLLLLPVMLFYNVYINLLTERHQVSQEAERWRWSIWSVRRGWWWQDRKM